MGRQTKCTPEVAERIAEHIRAGMGRENAARLVGVHPATLHRWMAKGERNVKPYRAFRERIQQASDTLQQEVSQTFMRGLRSKHDGTAVHTAQWLAERLWPDVYGKRQELRHSGPDGGPVAVAAEVTGRVAVGVFSAQDLSNMSPEQLEAALRGLGATEEEP